MQKFMVFDVESVGLHGEGFYVGLVVVDETGKELESLTFMCDPDDVIGTPEGRDWVKTNVPKNTILGEPMTLAEVRTAFWDVWLLWKERGATLWADCSWPVEARFLAECVDDSAQAREWEGPYPLHEIATLALACGVNPLGTFERLPNELPAHNPLNDAAQSARLLIGYMRQLGIVGV